MADDPLAAEITRHVACTCDHHVPGGPFERHYCAWCGEHWPCLVRRLADAHSRCTNLSNAEASRIFQEAKEQRELYVQAVERGCRDRDFWAGQARTAQAEVNRITTERDALRGALARYGVHLHYACELQDVCDCGLDAWRALAPSEGEESPHE